MSTSTPKQTNENEEIDLGVLFNSIGRGISKLFNAIGTVIVFLLNTLLGLVVFVRKRLLYFAVASGIGLLAGSLTETITPKKYIATATLEPHFESARQLYSNVDYLNDLAAQNDSVQLAAFFNISPSQAATLKAIEIMPFVTETMLLQEYNNYVTQLDSLVATETSFEKYVKQGNDYERQIHILRAQSTTQDIFSVLLDPILQSVSNIDYFKDQQRTALFNLELSDSITQVSIVQTDSLLSLFEEVRMVEANKEFSNGTNLYMSSSAKDNTEISLLNRKIELTNELEEIRTKKVKAKNVVDVISAFPRVGYLETSIWKNKIFLGFLAGVLLLSVFYLVLHLDAYVLSKNKD